ncbi:MAG: sulfurtransferase [Anaerolineae bacterium]|nr:sulfurtransferase [Anaerolineae bacterium]
MAAVDRFVTTEWLNNHLQDENVRIIDIRGRVMPASEPPPHYYSHYQDYETSHIPGAIFVDWTTDIVEPGSPSYDIANPERYGKLMSNLGVSAETHVVAYDDANGMFAARLWWTLQYYGHERVSVLAGGWQKWIAEDRSITSVIPSIERAIFEPHIQSQFHAAASDILASSNLLLIDTRSPAEFAGESSRASRAGRIPGAASIPRKSLLDVNGELLAADQLRTKFAAIGANAPKETVVYCNSGVSASFVMMAMLEAGFESVRVYDGSWKDWANNPDNPVE